MAQTGCLPACLAPPFFAPMPPGSHLAALRGPNYSMLLYLLLSAALLEDRQTGHHELFLHTINDEKRERESRSVSSPRSVCVYCVAWSGCALCQCRPFRALTGPVAQYLPPNHKVHALTKESWSPAHLHMPDSHHPSPFPGSESPPPSACSTSRGVVRNVAATVVRVDGDSDKFSGAALQPFVLLTLDGVECNNTAGTSAHAISTSP